MNENQTPATSEASDVAPDPVQTPETTPAPPDSPSPTNTPRGRATAVALVIALLALGLSIALAVAAYFTWHQVQRLSAAQTGIETGVSERIRPLRSALEGAERGAREEHLRLDNALAGLQADQRSVGHRLNVLAGLMGRSEHGWTLAEVEYLLRIANQRLQLQRDRATAREALSAADARLRDLADPHYVSVREQIARDLKAIEAVPPVDVEGLSAKLGAALPGVDSLSVAGSRYLPPTPAAATERDTTAGTLEELPGLIWSALSDLFRLREHDQAVKPMLAPEREYFLRENLRLQLSAARLALLRDDRAQYRVALATAGDWLDAHFDAEDAAVQQLVAVLDELAGVDITPTLPDVSQSLRVLRQQIKLSEQAQALPVVPESAPPAAKPAPASDPGADEAAL